MTVVNASAGSLVATLTGNGLTPPIQAGFDGERIVVTNAFGTLSLWRAADLKPLGSIPTGIAPGGVCSDGLDFWITSSSLNQLARF